MAEPQWTVIWGDGHDRSMGLWLRGADAKGRMVQYWHPPDPQDATGRWPHTWYRWRRNEEWRPMEVPRG